MKKFLYIFILLCIVGWAQAQQRVVYTINDGWKFTKGSPFEAQLAGCDDSSWAVSYTHLRAQPTRPY